MSSVHGWILLCLATAGAQHPHAPAPRAKPAPAVKGVALRGEPPARPPHPGPQPPAVLRAPDGPAGLASGMRF